MKSTTRVKFDADKLIEHFGGVRGTLDTMALVGVRLQLKTLQKQRERGHITADVVAALMLASAKAGKPINPYAFLLERKE